MFQIDGHKIGENYDLLNLIIHFLLLRLLNSKLSFCHQTKDIRPVQRSTGSYLYFSKVLTKLHKYLGETKLYPISTTGAKVTKNASLNIKCK